MDYQLKNKVVVVTGASRGLGLVIAELYMKEGAKVCIVARGKSQLYQAEKKLKEQFGNDHAYSFSADLGKEKDINGLVRFMGDKFGRLDVLVANAGLSEGEWGLDVSKDQWGQLLTSNLIGPALLVSACFPLLRLARGNIVFISSIAGLESLPAPVPYSTAKLGLFSVVKNFSRILAMDSVRVNQVCPGNILLPDGVWERKLRKNRKGIMAYIKTEVPLKRFASGEEIANAVLFLSSHLSSFTTGSTLVVDGGQTRGF